MPFSIKNKHIGVFLQNNRSLIIKIRLSNSVLVSDTNMKIFEHRKIGTRRKVINILFHKIYKDKKSCCHYFWTKNLNNIKNTIKKRFVRVVCYERISAPTSLNRHMLTCNSMTTKVYPKEKSFVSFDDKKSCKICFNNINNGIC